MNLWTYLFRDGPFIQAVLAQLSVYKMAANICAQLADVSGLTVLHENGLLDNNNALQLLCCKGTAPFSNWFNGNSNTSVSGHEVYFFQN